MNTIEPLIKSMKAIKLFGLYSYSLPEEDGLKSSAILYGDNGAGKSTILRLVFHLLSAESNRGHRNALYKAEFDSIEVHLYSGVIVSARQIMSNKPGMPKLLKLSVSHGDQLVSEWDFMPKSDQQSLMFDFDENLDFSSQAGLGKEAMMEIVSGYLKRSYNVGSSSGEKSFLEALHKYAPTMFILNADRRLDSDAVADPSDEVELRRVMRFEEPRRINDLVVRSREIALSQALSAAAQWIRKKALKGASQGSINVHSFYGNILQHLVTTQEKAPESIDAQDLISRLSKLETKTSELAKYEFETPLDVAAFKKSLSSTPKSRPKAELAAELLGPYIKSVESRLEAVEPIYNLVDKFVGIINAFLQDKEMSFTLSQGFTIFNRLRQKLEPNHLSSGEQQLLLLFCYVLTARENPSVFMIDEPEISLNIKWQRKLITSLLDITKEAKIQFIFASHSMELFAQHRKNVIRVMPGKTNEE